MDKEKLIEELDSGILMARATGTKLVHIYVEQAEEILALLKEQELKTGKWERQYSRPGVYANFFWWCSVCKEPTRYNDAGIFYKYCPHCGAKLEPCRET